MREKGPLFLLLTCWIIVGLAGMQKIEKEDKLQASIANKIIRLHILAPSDTKEDQELKLQVKDALLQYGRKHFIGCKNRKEAEEAIRKNKQKMLHVAQKVIKAAGKSYPVSICFEQAYFPIKIYGDLTFPAGCYEAVRIKIGAAQGHNWWCVMYPSLCFTQGTFRIVPDHGKQQLQHLLTKQQYQTLLKNGKIKIKVGWKIVDLCKQVKTKWF